MHPEALVLGGYALFLLGAAAGREVVRFLDDWPQLEAGRFHRGLALILIVLAALMALAALVRHHDPAELAVLGCVLALSGFAGRQLAPALIRRR
jgi:hypothetical protein